MTENNNYDLLYKDGQAFIDNILIKKYCLDGEKTYDDILLRFKRELELHHPNRVNDIDRIISMMETKRYIAGGSIQYGLGNKAKISLSNCYYIPIKNDSLESIYEAKKEAARIFSYRGQFGHTL